MSLNINLPVFIIKLWRMVNNREIDNEICWNESGTAIIIPNPVNFSSTILPQYYKHNNMSSFVRQLNMYDFRKIASSESGTMNPCNDKTIFFNVNFQRDTPQLLKEIKRKSMQNLSTTKQHIDSDNINLSYVLNEIRKIRETGETKENQLVELKHENAILWQELSLLKSKYMKQGAVLNNLVHFIMRFVQKQMKDGKILYQLQPNDSPSSSVNPSKSELDSIFQKLGLLPQFYGGSTGELDEEPKTDNSNRDLNTLVSWQKPSTSTITSGELTEEDEDNNFSPLSSISSFTELQDDSSLIQAVNESDVSSTVGICSDSNKVHELLLALPDSAGSSFDDDMNVPIDPMISGNQINSKTLAEFIDDQNEDRTDITMFDFTS